MSQQALTRNQQILGLYRSGKTLEEIGNMFQITRSRAQQIVWKELQKEIVAKLGISRISAEEKDLLNAAIRDEVGSIRSESKEKRVIEVRGLIHQRIMEKLEKVGGATKFIMLSELGRAIGETPQDIKEYAPNIAKEILLRAKSKWSRYYNQCRNCGTTSVRHVSYGLCENCYYKSEYFKEMQRSSRLRNYEKWKIRMREYSREYNKRPDVIAKKKILIDQISHGGNRVKALIRDGFTCQFCGRTQEQSLKDLKRDLYVEHISGLNDHRLENLITACRVCHMNKFRQKAGQKIAILPPKPHIVEAIKNQDLYSAIISLVSDSFGTSAKHILSNSRRKDYVLPRHVAIYLLRKVCGYSYPKIGLLFGRDHTSVMHAEGRVNEYATKDPQFKLELEALEKELSK